jgi:hypothetical protein
MSEETGAMPRKRLWEIEPRLQCPVVGTCLSLAETRRLARKAGLTESGSSDFECHHALVEALGGPTFAARLANKHLNQKYARVIARFESRADVRALADLWRQALAEGEVGAGFWAVVTHPATDAALLDRVYGEVHMLSHLSGHTHHAERQELHTLKRRVVELEEQLAWTGQAARARLKEVERQTEEIAVRQREAESLTAALAAAQKKILALETDETIVALRAENDKLHSALREQWARAEEIEREAREWASLALSTAMNRPSRGDTASALPSASCSPNCDAVEAGDCPGPDLCQRRILFVGGRDRQAAHFRLVVERLNGEFLHHDGGLNEATGRLESLLDRADAVVCPIDCVSHDACLRIKRHCKKNAKPFRPMRNASLSSFVRELREVVA